MSPSSDRLVSNLNRPTSQNKAIVDSNEISSGDVNNLEQFMPVFNGEVF